ncbi:MAG: PEP-CTERM sorting domain-containing protein [Thermoguttaceae bacterium]
MSNKMCVLVIAVTVVIFASAQCVWAADGYWLSTVTSTGDWSTPANWTSETVADGDGFTAYFTGDLADGAIITVNVDAGRDGQLIGNLSFNDWVATTPGSWLVQGSTTLNLKNSAGTSTISVTPVTDSLGTTELVAAEISAPVSVADGTSLTITGVGGGTLKLSGDTTVVNGNTTIQGSSIVNVTGTLSTLTTTSFNASTSTYPTTGFTTINGNSIVNLSGSAKLTTGYEMNMAMSESGGNGTLNIGLTSTDSVTAKVSSLYVGGGTNTGTINVRGISTLTTSGGWDEIQIGDWSTGIGVLNVYDSAVVSTTTLYLARWNSAVGTANVYNSGQLKVTDIWVGANSDPRVTGTGGTLNLYNNSSLTATNVYVGSNSNGTLTVNDNATVTVTGTLNTNRWGFWYAATPNWLSTATTTNITIGGSGGDRVALKAGTISMEDNWCSSVTNFTVTDQAKVVTIGDFYVGRWAKAIGNLTLNTDAQVTIGGQLILGQYDFSEGYVNVTDNAKLTAAGIQVSSGASNDYWGWQTHQLNISGDAKVSTTGDVTVGTTLHSGGFITVSGTGQLTVGGNFTVGASGGPWNDIKNSSTKAILVAGNLNLNAGAIYVPQITNDGTGVAGGIDVLGALKLNGGWVDATAGSTDFIKSAILVQAGGANFDTQGNNVTITKALAEDPASIGGGLAKASGGILTLTGALTYTGATAITGGTVQINTPGTSALAAISGAGSLGIGDGIVASTVSANSVSVDTLTIGAGSTLVIKALSGGPSSGGELTPVPEPSTFVLLAIAALGLVGAAWRRRNR